MDYLKIFSIFILCLSLSSSFAIQHRYGGGGRFKRPFAPSYEGSQGYSYSQQPQQQQRPPSFTYFQPEVQPSSFNPPQPIYSARPFGLPEEKPRFINNNAFTYKLPDTDPPPPPVKHGYISKPYSDYVVRFGSGSNGQLTVVNRPKPPTPSIPIINSFYANDNGNVELSPEVPVRQPGEVVNIHPPLTSVYVISEASDKKEGAKEAFVGLHKEPVFGSSPDNSVVRPLTPNQIVYSPNQKPSAEQGEEFKPMYVFGPVFYPKDNAGSGSSDENTAPSSVGSDSAAEDTKSVSDDETVSVSDESSSSSSSSSKTKGKGGRRGILKGIGGIIKGLLGTEAADDLELTNSRADEDAEDEEFEDEIVSHRRTPTNYKSKSGNKDGGNRKDNEDLSASVNPTVEEKKETDVNGNVAQNPQQNLESGSQDSANDPDPIVGPMQIGFIGSSPHQGFAEVPIQPFFYPAGIPLYNKPQLNPFSPSGIGFSNEQFGFEADHTQPHHQQEPQSQSSAQFTPEMIKHEEEKIRQNFENQQEKNSQTFENTAEAVEATDSQLVDKPEVTAHIEQGIAIDSKRETTVASVDHTDRYDDQSTITDTEGGHINANVDASEKETLVDKKEETSTAYADMKPDIPVSYYTDVSPASQMSSVLQVEQTFNSNDNANFNGNVNANVNYNGNSHFGDHANFDGNGNKDYSVNGRPNYNVEDNDKANFGNKDSFNSKYNDKGNYNENFNVNDNGNENVNEEQTSTASVSTRKPFPPYHQRYFRPKNRNYIAPTTYRPSYPRTPSPATATEYASPVSVDLVEDNQLDDQNDNGATLYKPNQYEPLAEQSSGTSSAAVTPVIHVQPYGDRQMETANSETVETVAQMPVAPYGSRIKENNSK
ncbi:hypothetical protein CHUAL_006951 [Chamberlinius hualienensis]